jgi:hypothetical protein
VRKGMSEVYEFVDNSNKVDENVLAVDFHFDSDVTKEQAIKMVDRICKGIGIRYTPTIFAISKWKENDDK